MTNPTPSKDGPIEVPLQGYIAEIKRLTDERDELVRVLRWARERIDSKAPHRANETNSEYHLRMFAALYTYAKVEGGAK